MTKEEFKGFSSSAQHDMVLEALVRITKNLETMEKESGKPFMGTSKQRRNDIKLLTILAEAFGKNQLIWRYPNDAIKNAAKYCEADVQEIRDFKDYMDKSKPQPLNPIEGVRDDMNKIVGAQQKAGKFMSYVSIDDKSIYPVKSIDNSGISRNVVEGFKKVSNDRMAKRRSK